MYKVINTADINLIEKYFKTHKYHKWVNFNLMPNKRFIEKVIHLFNKWIIYPKLSVINLNEFIRRDELYKFKAAELIVSHIDIYGDTLLDAAIFYNSANIFTYLLPRYLHSYKYYVQKLTAALSFMDSHAAAILVNAGYKFECSFDNLIKISKNPNVEAVFKILEFQFPKTLSTALLSELCIYPRFANMVIKHYELNKLSTDFIKNYRVDMNVDIDNLISHNISAYLWNIKDAIKYINNDPQLFLNVLELNRFPQLIEIYGKKKIFNQITKKLLIKLIENGLLRHVTYDILDYYLMKYNINFMGDLYKYFGEAEKRIIIKLLRMININELHEKYINNQYSPLLNYLMHIHIYYMEFTTNKFNIIVRDIYRKNNKLFKTQIINTANALTCKPGGIAYRIIKIKYQPAEEDIIYLNNYYFSRKFKSADIKYIKLRTENYCDY